MNIYPNCIEEIQNDTLINFPIEYSDNTNDKLRYRIEKSYTDYVTDFLDAPLVALIIPAMYAGEDIYLHGTISERLYYNLSGPYQAILKHLIPTLKSINIFPENLISNSKRSPGVATGFSCGIDSFSLLGKHYYSDVVQGFKITHLLFHNVGSHGTGGERLFEARYAKNRQIADKIGLPLIKVNSNLEKFYQPFIYEHTDTQRNASVPLLLQKGIGRYLYASAYGFPDIYLRPSTLMTHSDLIALPLLSTESVDMVSTGSEYNRVEKTIQVAKIEESYDSLDVCIHPGSAGNCSKCAKCLRTLLTLDIAGLTEKYSSVFDLSIYQEQRTRYIGEVIISDDPFLREIREFAEQENYEFPKKSYLFAVYLKIQRHFPRMMRVIKRALRRVKKIINA